MAGLDIAAGAVGIASLGIQVCQGLLFYYDGWKDYGSDTSGARASIAELSETLVLLKASLENGGLDQRRKEQVETCLESCTDALGQLEKKLAKLQKYERPEGLRQKARAELQRMWFPFRKDMLSKSQANVGDVRERLKLALQVLQLDASQRMLATQHSDQFRKIVDWLSPPDPWTNHESARRKHEDRTGGWLLQCNQYKRWKAGNLQQLWMHGKAGCGKTILCSTIIDDMRLFCHANANIKLAVFYFSFSDNQKQTRENLVRSLVAQLGWKEPALSMLRRIYEKPDRSLPDLDELDKILYSAIKAHGKVFLVLDALDECPAGEVRQSVLDQLQSIAQRTKQLHMFVASRDLRDVRETMRNLQADQVAVTARAVNADIQQYVSGQLSRDQMFSHLNSKSRVEVEETIMEKADGMFRWAYCQVQELKKLEDHRPSYVRKALNDLPPTLEETYARMLDSIRPIRRADAMVLLQWLAYARKPPTLGQLVDVLVIDVASDSVDFADRGSLEGTLNILTGLVTVIENVDHDQDQGTLNSNVSSADNSSKSPIHSHQQITADTQVRLAHVSVKEYLESDQVQASRVKAFYLNPSEGHRLLARSCMTYLAHYSNSKDKTYSQQDLKTFPLVQYAAQSWFYHSSLQLSEDATQEVDFLTSEQFRKDWLSVFRPDRHLEPAFAYQEIGNPISSLYYASFVGLHRVVEVLLSHGADVNARAGRYGNALQAALYNDHTTIVHLLLDAGADVNLEGGRYGNALYTALSRNRTEMAQLLVEKGANTNARGGTYGTILQAASFRGNYEVVQLLLANGVDVNMVGGKYVSAFEAAITGCQAEIAELLLKHGANSYIIPKVYGSLLQRAASAGQAATVKLLLEQSPPSPKQGYLEKSFVRAISAAIYSERDETAELLLKYRARADAAPWVHGAFDLALPYACFKSQTKMVRMLLEQGADVNAQSKNYGTALQAAKAGGNADILSLLLDRMLGTSLL